MTSRSLPGFTQPDEPAIDALSAEAVALLKQSGSLYARGSGQPLDTHAIWVRLTERVVTETLAEPPRKVPVIAQTRRSPWVTRSIGLVLAAGFAIGAFAIVRDGIGPKFINETRSYETLRGQQADITLPDGSRATLAPDTRLRYTASAEGERTLELEGQAYFTVTANQAHPFVVRASGVATRVLGTAFAVRAYAGDPYTQVAVSEGKVSFADGARSTILVAGDVGRAVADGQPTVVRANTMNAALAWMRGEMVFDATPLRLVAAELERVYDVRITISSTALKDLPVTIAFSNEPLSEILHTIALTANARFTRNGQHITFLERS